MGYNLEHYKNISGVELRQMTTQELKLTLQQIAMHTNSRISQIKRSGVEPASKAANALLKNYSNGLTSKGDQTRSQLIKQIKAGQKFLNSKTSTVSGTRNMMYTMLDIIGADYAEYKNDAMAFIAKFGNDFWDVYNRLAEENPEYKEDSEGLIQAVDDIMEEKPEDIKREEWLYSLLDKARKKYIKMKYGDDIEFESSEDLAKVYRRRK